ncbi:hypothetical protein, partial [Campylobacter sp. RM5063]|uniref:hypothetical protein n=1 Tax=Campylobacter sp. RM5063 TaxID=2735747 RepID=UPI00215226FA
KKSITSMETFTSENINLYQYNIKIDSDKTEIASNETFKITLSGGKPNASVTWSVKGDGNIKTKDQKFNAEGKAFLNGEGKSPFNTDIEIQAQSLGKNLSKKIKIAPLPDKLYIGDYSNRYTGYYSSDGKTAYITGKIGEKGQYLYFFGFEDSLIGQHVNVEVDRDGLGFRNKNFKVTKYTAGSGNYYNLDNSDLGPNAIGILITESEIPRGTYNITFKYNNKISKYVLIKQIN